ncbi:MAG: sulfatase-like hydrolase/transferase [Verrucomicrobia bacterium]|nr:sulfatase-like hydrolase/transferase [Verrucomicrobiota bacterium]
MLPRLPASFTLLFSLSAAIAAPAVAATPPDTSRPHIVLVMADDMGWGETSYYRHPVLKTPNLDAMAAAGLRFDRFYAGAPNCSPTRATVMTGRSNDRCGVENHGFALRRQEKTIAQGLRQEGYRTAHFGKWHLNGYRGPGAPILGADDHSPGAFGFDEWLSVTNFFDRDPILSRQGKWEEFKGDSSEVVVDEALKHLARAAGGAQPTFTVIWFGTPHAPMIAAEADMKDFGALARNSANHYGELVAMDRSIGTLRAGLRRLGMAENTLLWFCSDNGGLPEIQPGTVGEFRGFKGSVYEGGLRVPGIVEWPAVIKAPRVTTYPCGTFDIFPTVAEITRLPATALLQPVDGISLRPLFTTDLKERGRAMGFRHTRRAALIEDRYKIVALNLERGPFQVFDLVADPREQTDLAETQPALTARLKQALLAWNASVQSSYEGKDYPEGRVDPREPGSRDWVEAPEYAPYLRQLQARPEYSAAITKGGRKKKG